MCVVLQIYIVFTRGAPNKVVKKGSFSNDNSDGCKNFAI